MGDAPFTVAQFHRMRGTPTLLPQYVREYPQADCGRYVRHGMCGIERVSVHVFAASVGGTNYNAVLLPTRGTPAYDRTCLHIGDVFCDDTEQPRFTIKSLDYTRTAQGSLKRKLIGPCFAKIAV